MAKNCLFTKNEMVSNKKTTSTFQLNIVNGGIYHKRIDKETDKKDRVKQVVTFSMLRKED